MMQRVPAPPLLYLIPRGRTRVLRLALLTASIGLLPGLASGAVPMTGSGSYSQNFDTLPNTGPSVTWTDDTTLENWFSSRETLLPGTGTSNSGQLYSFGADAVAERALGSVASGSTDTLYFGVLLQNTDASPVEISSVSYTGEQWRNGGNNSVNSLTVEAAVSAFEITGIGDGVFAALGGLDFDSPVTTGSAGALDGNVPANRVAISSATSIIVQPGEYVMIRWADPDNASSDHGLAIDDLTIEWEPSSGMDTTPPSVLELSPADDATGVPLDGLGQLSLTFSENITTTSGDILVKRMSDDSIVNTIDVSDFGQIELLDATLGLIMANPLDYGTSYYVEIPSGAIEDIAGNPFDGFTGNTTWNFTVADEPVPPAVVVNKYLNGTPDRVELLVVGNQAPGNTVDLQGMIIKDFSSNLNNDGGGKYVFTNDPLWSAVPVGTLITLSLSSSSPDTDFGNFTLSIGLDDPAYFTPDSGTFNIAGIDMVMIKEAGSGAAGTTGGIHALAAGEPGDQFTNFAGAKVIATTSTSSNQGVRVDNSTSTLADYISGSDATGGLFLTAGEFGAPNSGTNAAFIAALRGLTVGDGDGLASVINVTSGSPFDGLGMFDDGLSAQSAELTLSAQISGVTLTDVVIEVPASLGTPSGATLSGPASAGAGFVLDGQTITVSSAAVTDTDSLVVTIDGLDTPTPTLASDNGNYNLTVSTSTSGGTLAQIANQPAARVIIPIASLRDIDANGVALDSGAIVAVEGVATEEDFGSGSANFSGFIQDSTAGINLFSPVDDPSLVRGNRYAVLGTVLQFSGLTEISPASGADIVDLGADVEPAPQIVTIPDLLASAEDLEGSLVTIENLLKVSGTWTNNQNVVVRDAMENTITIRIQNGSTATPEPTFPLTVTGIVGQFDGQSPLTSGYQIMPRDPSDLAEGSLGDFDTWAIENNVTEGMAGDDDEDGMTNEFEYAFGLDPQSGASVNPYVAPLDPATATFTYTRRTQALTGLNYAVYTSTTLEEGEWTEDMGATVDVSGPVDDVETVEVTLSAPAPLTAPRLFVRVVAEESALGE